MKILFVVALIVVMSIIGVRMAENMMDKVQARQAQIAAEIGGGQ